MTKAGGALEVDEELEEELELELEGVGLGELELELEGVGLGELEELEGVGLGELEELEGVGLGELEELELKLEELELEGAELELELEGLGEERIDDEVTLEETEELSGPELELVTVLLELEDEGLKDPVLVDETVGLTDWGVEEVDGTEDWSELDMTGERVLEVINDSVTSTGKTVEFKTKASSIEDVLSAPSTMVLETGLELSYSLLIVSAPLPSPPPVLPLSLLPLVLLFPSSLLTLVLLSPFDPELPSLELVGVTLLDCSA